MTSPKNAKMNNSDSGQNSTQFSKNLGSLYKFYFSKEYDYLFSDFYQFNFESQSPTMLVLMNLALMALVYPFVLINLSVQSDVSSAIGSTAIVLAFITLVFSWLLYFSRLYYNPTVLASLADDSSSQEEERRRGRTQFLNWLTKHRFDFQAVTILSLTLLLGLGLIQGVYSGHSSKSETDGRMHRNIYAQINALPASSTVWLLLVSIIYVNVTRESRLWVVLPTILVVIISMVISAARLNSNEPGGIIICYALYGVLGIVDHLKLLLRAFLLNRKLKDALAENERMAEQTHANEMRHMIANVAHDLKTPLSSFMAGMELINEDLGNLGRELDDSSTSGKAFAETKANLVDILGSLKGTVKNIMNTNSFMLMTINRCLDYTKASSGLKLIPKYESIHLSETLYLPMECMTNIQNKVAIKLSPIEKEICSFVITDKQWLQENVLCLLSNAVKYSNGGEVTITVSHRQEGSLPRYREEKKELPLDGSEETTKGIEHAKRILKAIESTESMNHGGTMTDLETGNISTSESQPPAPETCKVSGTMSYLLVEIEDKGIGLSDEAMQSLFSPFKQSQRLAGGTGLGLFSLAKRLDALNGRYGVRKRKDGGQGSLFWFALPYRPDFELEKMRRVEEAQERERWAHDHELHRIMTLPMQPNPAAAILSLSSSTLDLKSPMSSSSDAAIIKPEPEGDPIPRAATSSNVASIVAPCGNKPAPLRILITDDSPSIVKMTTKLLERLGHVVSSAENGMVSLNMVKSSIDEEQCVTGYDVVLMDLQMPVMDGLEATRRIREQEKMLNELRSDNKALHQLIIGVSANSDHETMQEALKAGVDTFISKPFTADTFNKAIKNYLGNRV